MTWSLVTVMAGGVERVAVSCDDGIVTLPSEVGDGDLIALLDRWPAVRAVLEDWTPAHAEPLTVEHVLAPLRYPRKLICAGANYVDHVVEMGSSVPDQVEPFFFSLPPTTTIIGPGEPILIPDDPTLAVDWEAELAVVIGARCRDVTPEEVPGVVAGYTAFNDISARGVHRRENPLAPPFAFDWLSSKAQDTFGPLGPGVVPAWQVGDAHDLGIRCWINGQLKQNSDTGGMINDVAQLVAAVSRIMTLEPGDVLATGTPAGVGAARGEFLRPGDTVTIEIDRIGRLENPIVARADVATRRTGSRHSSSAVR
jgi:2-keto-4-pentenoate hydratase/2-oxohepta-3-ene-1,7-dioic acid hydratase in catechol pathway